MQRKTWLSLGLVAALLAGLGVAQYLRAKAPPEAARLLPESDAIFYVHLSPLRAATHFDASPVLHSGDLRRFEAATGFVPERDLDGVALALHRMPDPRGPNGPVAYSEVFAGHFDGPRLQAYLAGLATARENYAGRDIFNIPVEGRTLRVVQLAYDMVAASNTPTAEQIHSIVDRSRMAGVSQPGSSLLRARYGEVPLLAQAWGIGHIGLPFSERGHIAVMGLELPLREDADLVASLRWRNPASLKPGAVQLQVQEIAPSEAAAERSAQAVLSLLNIVRGVSEAQPAATAASTAMREVLDSVSVNQWESRAVLEATATPEQLRALATAHPAAETSEKSGPGATSALQPASESIR